MYCLICKPYIRLKEAFSDEDNGMFYQYYSCPNCGELHVCSSQSEDMVQEYLELCE